MFGHFFRKATPNRDIDSLLRDIADFQKPNDYSEFLGILPSLNLFLSLAGPLPTNLPQGQEFQIPDGVELKAKTANIQGFECLLLFTSAEHPKLGNDYAAISGSEAMKMLLRLPNLGGLLVQSTGTAWVGLNRDQVSHALGA